MTRFAFSLTSIVVLILALISVDNDIVAKGINPKDRIKEQDKSVFGTGKVYTISESVKYYHTSAVIIPEKNDPIDMAYQFFELNRGHFPMKNVREEFRFTGRAERKLTFKQVYKSVLTEAELGVWFDDDDEIDRFELTYYEISALPTSPKIGSGTAERLALKDLSYLKGVKIAGSQTLKKENLSSKKLEDLSFASDYSTRLTIWCSREGNFHLVWAVCAQQESSPYSWKFYIDAYYGRILEKRDEIHPFLSVGTYKSQRIRADLEEDTEYKIPPKDDPVEMAYRFFELNKDSFLMNNPRNELIVPGKVMDEKTKVVTFLQTHNGIPIWNNGIRVHFTPQGEMRIVDGVYFYDISLPSTPTIDSASAVKIALQAMGSPHPKVLSANKLMIVSSKTYHPNEAARFHLVRIVAIFPDSAMPHGPYRQFYVDVLYGAIFRTFMMSTYWGRI
ncbi:MAG: hypothetical protein A2142_08930 [candidate division Zixibacteria bacterium RBG_16_48_11]|nr:MAG: hypothetical protein A2142_08930 [candidate division Zixibacteria bacterium RBG_16_48_11]